MRPACPNMKRPNAASEAHDGRMQPVWPRTSPNAFGLGLGLGLGRVQMHSDQGQMQDDKAECIQGLDNPQSAVDIVLGRTVQADAHHAATTTLRPPTRLNQHNLSQPSSSEATPAATDEAYCRQRGRGRGRPQRTSSLVAPSYRAGRNPSLHWPRRRRPAIVVIHVAMTGRITKSHARRLTSMFLSVLVQLHTCVPVLLRLGWRTQPTTHGAG